jgi:hypothetical protein
MSVASNAKHKRNEPVVRFHTGRHGRPTYAHEVEILGPSKVIYSAHNPSCRVAPGSSSQPKLK